VHDRSDPVRSDPVRPDPVRSDPVRPAPVRPAPDRPAPDHPVVTFRPAPPRSARPRLTVLRGGRADAQAPFVVAPPALQRLDRVVTQAEIDLLRCRRVWRTVR
jgi:hypothetical protein